MHSREPQRSSRSNKLINESLDAVLAYKDFVSVDKEAKKGTYVRLPERQELNSEINELLVVEFYNRQ